MNLKTERKEQSRSTILESAARLVRDKGIGGARVADVMAGAGLTVGGFYAHFASKTALVDEVLGRTAAEMRARLFSRLADKPAESRAGLVIDRYLAGSHRDDTLRGCPLPAIVGEVATTAPEHRDAVAAQVAAMGAELAQHLEAEPSGLKKKHLALGLVALMYGGLTLARATRGTSLSDELLRACRALGRFAVGQSQGSATEEIES